MEDRGSPERATVRLLSADPDLALGIDEAELPLARRLLVVPLVQLQQG